MPVFCLFADFSGLGPDYYAAVHEGLGNLTAADGEMRWDDQEASGGTPVVS